MFRKPGLYITLLYSLCCLPGLRAQSVEQTLAFANAQKELAHYDNAIPAYLRVLYFDKQNPDAPAIFKNLADCYFEKAMYEKASEYYDLVYYSETNEGRKTEALFRKTSCLLLRNEFHLALAELFNLPDNLNDTSERWKNFYLGITYFGLNQNAVSKEYFTKVLNGASPEEMHLLENLFEKQERNERIKPKTAKILSMILPGLGQFYAGDIKNGINSFLLIGVFAALYINTAAAYSLLEAYIVVFPWFQRYYAGGFKKAELNAIKRNEVKSAAVYREIIGLMETVLKK